MKHRPLNPVMEESLRQQIDRWMEQGVVEKADSLWSFPLVPVPKKNRKEIRWAVHYRQLNTFTKKDAFPLPNIADNLSHLSGSHVFSALDGAGAFHAVPVRLADHEKTAFSSPFCHYQFIKMPFGLANSPAMYSRLVTKALRHLSSSEVLCYLDDTAIHSEAPGATCESSGRYLPPSAQPAFKSPQRRHSCSRITSNTWDTRSALKGSAPLRNTPLSIRTGRSRTRSRPYGPS